MGSSDVHESFQVELLQLLIDLRSTLQGFGHPRKMLIHVLRRVQEILGADESAVFLLSRHAQTAELLYSIPSHAQWNYGLLNDYIKGRRPSIPTDTIVARVRRRERSWGAVAVRFADGRADVSHVRALWAILDIVSEAIAAYDDTQINQLRHRIEHKVANRQHPKDIVYDILHGIRDLTRYDHSASFWLTYNLCDPLELIAEQIAWTKAKSRRIGQKIEIPEEVARDLKVPGVRLCDSDGEGWWESPGGRESGLAALLDAGGGEDGIPPPERAMLCAVVATPDGSIGLLKVSSQNRSALGGFEAALVQRLLPLVSVALQFLHRTGELEDQILRAERKYALANLTRGIAHDVNNALGSVLPLVQQIRADLSERELREDLLRRDLAVIESGLQTCRRIFSGMLACARANDRSIGHGNLRRAIDGAVSVMQDRLRRCGVDLTINVPTEMSTLRGNQGDIIQVFLNLFSNAVDAMSRGGSLCIDAREVGSTVVVSVADTGQGIAATLLPRVFDPFITTKSQGNGLGLSICRSIMWELGGEMAIHSEVERGTTVTLRFPIQNAVAGVAP
ncbi:HAMP domain-containing histidine kinase [bacterium]|nr:HAMP domain-containing histidine kinase [bacterium]